MKYEFVDREFAQGWVEDTGDSYRWEYGGENQVIIDILKEAPEWTGVDTGPVEDASGETFETPSGDTIEIAPLPGERFDAPLNPETRIRKVQRMIDDEMDWSRVTE